MFVSNTSTLILLGKVTALQSFVDAADSIIIPEEVRNEYLDKQTFETLLIEKEIDRGKIIVRPSDSKKTQFIMSQFHIDEGEAAAYNLFDPKKHKAILTDDGELIKLCKIERIPFICALAVVLRLYEKKSLTKKEALEKIDRLVDVGRYSKDIVQYFRQEVN